MSQKFAGYITEISVTYVFSEEFPYLEEHLPLEIDELVPPRPQQQAAALVGDKPKI